jgi:hypothetical protein
MPICRFTTAMTPPPTPLAGIPTRYAHCPGHMPHVNITDSMLDAQNNKVERALACQRLPAHVARQGHPTAGGDAETIEDGFERLWTVALVKQRGHGDGAGIHHGIVRAIRPILQLYRVEGVPARFDVDVLAHAVLPEFFQGHPVGEGLGDRLDGEGPWSQSPASKTRPSAVTTQTPKCSGFARPNSGM